MGLFSRKDRVDELRSELREEFESQLGEVKADIRLQSGTKLPPPRKVQTALRGLRRQSPATTNWKTARGLLDPGEYQTPVHNLREISKAVDVESYFARSVDRHLDITLKQGWRLKGRDQRRIKYITRRLHEICMISNTTPGQMIEDTARDLFTYANHQWVFKRDALRSSGGPIRLYKRRLEPIAGIYQADPTSMSVKQNRSGNIHQWKLSIENHNRLGTGAQRDRKYPASDVIQFFMNRKTGFLFGTPFVTPVLDDMRLLRRLEELTDIIAHKHAFPLMVVKIGSEKDPADEVMMPNGQMIPEVDLAREQVENLDFEGGLVVTERYDINLVGAEGKAIDLGPYLEYLEKRVLGGLRLSEIDLGRGDSSNRNTAQSITQTLEDACSRVQRHIEEVITWKVFFPLLMEGGFDVDLGDPDQSMVFFDFPPINREEQRAQENHALAMYQGQVCTEDECRVDMGRRPLTDPDREGLHLQRVEKPSAEIEAEQKAKLEKQKAAQTVKTQPTNQHGQSATKPRIKKDRLQAFTDSYVDQVAYHYSVASEMFLEGLSMEPGQDQRIADRWKDNKPRGLSAQETRRGYQATRLTHYTRDAEAYMLVDARAFLVPIINAGLEDAIGHAEVSRNFVTKDEIEHFFKNSIREGLKNALRSTSGALRLWPTTDRHPDRLRIRSGLEAHGTALLDTSRRQSRLAYAFGFLTGASLMEAKAVNVIPQDGHRSCKACAPRTVSADASAEEVVCFRPDCRVEYSVVRETSS